jgi:hypothetical protein
MPIVERINSRSKRFTIGVVVGTAVIACLITVAFVSLYNKRVARKEMPLSVVEQGQKAELDGDEIPRQEVPTLANIVELDTTTPRTHIADAMTKNYDGHERDFRECD